MDYYLTNLISVKSFIENIDARSLSMDDGEFKKNMQAARLAMKGTVENNSSGLESSAGMVPTMRRRGKEIHFEGQFAFKYFKILYVLYLIFIIC